MYPRAIIDFAIAYWRERGIQLSEANAETVVDCAQEFASLVDGRRLAERVNERATLIRRNQESVPGKPDRS